MNQPLSSNLFAAWPVLLVAGLLLGCATTWAVERRANLMWFFPVLLVASAAFVMVTGGSVSTPLIAPEKLGVGVVAMAVPVAVSLAVAAWVLHLRAPHWVLVAAPALACLLCTPIAGYVGLLTICELTGDCP